MLAFIGGIPASGKSYLAEKVTKIVGAVHIDIDDLRKEMRKDEKLRFWVDFFINQDEEKYWQNMTCEEHWQNLVNQSEAFWPAIVSKINEIIKNDKPAIFEGVNILPHLAVKDLRFPGIFLLGESFEKILERNRKNPRWGKTEQLQRKEAKMFFYCEGPKYKEEAEKYGYKVFTDYEKAQIELLNMFGC